MNRAELIARHWFLRRPGDAEEGRFYMPGTNPYQQRGLEVDDGWLPLLDDLFTKIDLVVKRDRLRSFEIAQVKEKFGGLRVYVDGANDEIHELIREAEVKASETCETCGALKATLRGVEGDSVVGRVATRCDRCEARRKRATAEEDDDE